MLCSVMYSLVLASRVAWMTDVVLRSGTKVPRKNSVLQKKANSIAYHFVREGTSCDEWRIAYINTHENIADLLTKPLGGEKRKYFIRQILHHLYS